MKFVFSSAFLLFFAGKKPDADRINLQSYKNVKYH